MYNIEQRSILDKYKAKWDAINEGAAVQLSHPEKLELEAVYLSAHGLTVNKSCAECLKDMFRVLYYYYKQEKEAEVKQKAKKR